MIFIAASKSPQYDCSDAYSGSYLAYNFPRLCVSLHLYTVHAFSFCLPFRLTLNPRQLDFTSDPIIFIIIVFISRTDQFSLLFLSSAINWYCIVISKYTYSYTYIAYREGAIKHPICRLICFSSSCSFINPPSAQATRHVSTTRDCHSTIERMEGDQF